MRCSDMVNSGPRVCLYTSDLRGDLTAATCQLHLTSSCLRAHHKSHRVPPCCRRGDNRHRHTALYTSALSDGVWTGGLCRRSRVRLASRLESRFRNKVLVCGETSTGTEGKRDKASVMSAAVPNCVKAPLAHTPVSSRRQKWNVAIKKCSYPRDDWIREQSPCVSLKQFRQAERASEREINVSVGKTALVGVLNYSNDGEEVDGVWVESASVGVWDRGRQGRKKHPENKGAAVRLMSWYFCPATFFLSSHYQKVSWKPRKLDSVLKTGPTKSARRGPEWPHEQSLLIKFPWRQRLLCYLAAFHGSAQR